MEPLMLTCHMSKLRTVLLPQILKTHISILVLWWQNRATFVCQSDTWKPWQMATTNAWYCQRCGSEADRAELWHSPTWMWKHHEKWHTEVSIDEMYLVAHSYGSNDNWICPLSDITISNCPRPPPMLAITRAGLDCAVWSCLTDFCHNWIGNCLDRDRWALKISDHLCTLSNSKGNSKCRGGSYVFNTF